MPVSATITRMMNNLRIQLPGAVDGAIQLEFFNAVEEFCSLTNVWLEKINISVVAGDTTYSITPTNGQIIRLMSIVDQNEVPVASTMSLPGEVILASEPNVAGTYVAQVAKTVSDVDGNNYPVIDDWILDKYNADITDGIIGKMMVQPSKPYTNERMAIYHLRRFANAAAIARSEARHQNLYAGQRWRFPQTFNRH